MGDAWFAVCAKTNDSAEDTKPFLDTHFLTAPSPFVFCYAYHPAASYAASVHLAAAANPIAEERRRFCHGTLVNSLDDSSE